MFSLAIKNFIIGLLILLIIHFLLKNMLRDLEHARVRINPIVNHNVLNAVQSEEPEGFTFVEPKTQHSTVDMTIPVASKTVQMPVESEESELDRLFKDAIVSKTEDDALFSHVYANDKQPTTSANVIGAGSGIRNVDTISDDKNKDKDKGTSNQFFVNDYEKESILNGGAIYGGITAFDNSFNEYSELSPI
jgi:hypothetical protein